MSRWKFYELCNSNILVASLIVIIVDAGEYNVDTFKYIMILIF